MVCRRMVEVGVAGATRIVLDDAGGVVRAVVGAGPAERVGAALAGGGEVRTVGGGAERSAAAGAGRVRTVCTVNGVSTEKLKGSLSAEAGAAVAAVLTVSEASGAADNPRLARTSASCCFSASFSCFKRSSVATKSTRCG